MRNLSDHEHDKGELLHRLVCHLGRLRGEGEPEVGLLPSSMYHDVLEFNQLGSCLNSIFDDRLGLVDVLILNFAETHLEPVAVNASDCLIAFTWPARVCAIIQNVS